MYSTVIYRVTESTVEKSELWGYNSKYYFKVNKQIT